MENEIVFTRDDIDLFATVSHDWNPLHCSDAYARKTPYGEVVVHGVLGILACLGKFNEYHNPITIKKIKATFLKPIFCNVTYNFGVKNVDGGGRNNHC